jgi:thiosulfate/3-mercaptopyruvate sulfurtransferase
MEVYLDSDLISVDWLIANLGASNLIVLDATINKTITTTSEKISKARFFDIKNKFSDVNGPFPSTLPSAIQFQKKARALGINKNSALVVYDDKGIYSSARAWWLFKVFGFENVAVLDGGLPEWKNHNLEVKTYNTNNYLEGDFEAKFNSALITNFLGIKDFSTDSKALIIDARSIGRFQCKVDEPREGLRRGTITNSKNLPYTKVFNGNIMKPKAELSIIFNNLVEHETVLVFSCGSGITACILALAASQCNYKNLVVYDGSWTEYGTLIR